MRERKDFWDRNAGLYDRFMRKDGAAYERDVAFFMLTQQKHRLEPRLLISVGQRRRM